MKRNILTIIISVFLIVTSCNERQSKQIKTTDKGSNNNQNTENNIVADSVTNEEGKTLYMAFNNTKRTATFIFDSDTIILKQDTMGSGIKYSNDHYEFTEWHGTGELKKESKTIFKYSN